jgi:hypothetical protein
MIGLAAVGILLICIFGFLLLRSLNQQPDAAATAESDGRSGTPTPFPSDAAGGETAQEEPLVVGVSESSTVTLTLDAPVSLQVNGRSFSVQPQIIQADGVWNPAGLDENSAAWVYGTIINYVLGVADADQNEALLEQLTPDDEIALTTRSGQTHTFTFSGRQTVQPDSRDLFAQTTPGITLVLLQSGSEERLAVQGRYVVPETNNLGGSDLFELGETAQLGDVQVTLDSATYLPDRPEAPAGFAFFLADYTVQNLGLSALDTSNLEMTLVDELGNQYAVSPVASRLGNFQPLSGFINAGQQVQATIGYQIPVGLSSATLRWRVSYAGDNGQLVFSIPFPGGGASATGTAVSLQDVALSPDGAGLILSGQVTNMSNQPVVVSENDVSLRTEDGSTYLLLSVRPAFPWTAPAGQQVPFTVTYQRPPASTAIFTVLNQPFQLSQLR